MRDHRPQHQSHYGVGRDSQTEHRNEISLRRRVVRRFRSSDTFDRPLSKQAGTTRNLALKTVGAERRDRPAAAW